MKQPVVIVGTGEIGGVCARGFLRLGHPVFPVNRDMSMVELAQSLPEPALVLIAVGEADLHSTLADVPLVWRERIALLQNELLPRDWLQHGFDNPTAISIWFEKKKGMDAKVLLPSPAFGPAAKLLVDALQTLDIAAREVNSAAEMAYELVRKNIYILTLNIAGLECGGNVEELWSDHHQLMQDVAREVMDIQDFLVGKPQDRERLLQGLKEGIDGDLQHGCTGRSAPARLIRNLEFADEAGLAVTKLREIKEKYVY
jgi:ketopantoate reductase